MTSPTNTDIMVSLGRIEEQVNEVKILAQKTNGRVTTIENWKNGLEAVDQYKKENPPQATINNQGGTVVVQQKWFQNEKLVGAVVALMLAFATAIGFVVGGK